MCNRYGTHIIPIQKLKELDALGGVPYKCLKYLVDDDLVYVDIKHSDEDFSYMV